MGWVAAWALLLFFASVWASLKSIRRLVAQRHEAEAQRDRAEAARLDALEAVGLAGEARRAMRAEHAAETERMSAAHSETIDALQRANERADAATAELATARQWNTAAARTHAVEVAGLKSDLTTARRTIDRLEDCRAKDVELANGIISEK